MNFRATKRARAALVMDVTPLIDIVFLLLIFFLITTTFVRKREMVITINLPEGSAEAMAAADEDLTVHVGADGRFTLSSSQAPEEGRTMESAALENELRTLYATDPDLAIYLRGDREVDYGAVIDILLLAREIGFERVQAVIREQQSGSAP